MHSLQRSHEIVNTPEYAKWIREVENSDSRLNKEELEYDQNNLDGIAGIRPENIPNELAQLTRWMCWVETPRPDGGKPGKPPIKVRLPFRGRFLPASPTNPANWTSLERALIFYRFHIQGKRIGGIHFALTSDTGIVGIDLDGCRDPETGVIADWATRIVTRFDSYTEISPSGTGIRIFIRGTLPVDGRRTGRIEVYANARVLSVTGNIPDGSFLMPVEDRQAELSAWFGETFGEIPEKLPQKREGSTHPHPSPAPTLPREGVTLDQFRQDHPVAVTILDGRWKDNTPYKSQSSADQALANLAVAYGFTDVAVASMIRQAREASGENPEKGEREDYIRRTLEQARQPPPFPLDKSTSRQDDRTTGHLDVCRSVDSSTCRPVESVEFPVEVFPQVLQGFIRSIAKALPCPVDYPGAMVLPVLGSLIGRKRCIELKEGWEEYPLLWLVAVGRSGEKKSPVLSKITAPLVELQAQEQANFDAEMRDWLKEKDRRKDELAERGEDEDEPPLGPPPTLRQVYTTDSTIEGLKEVLSENPSFLFYADEAIGWHRAMSQYKGGKGSDRAEWLKLWSCIAVAVKRKGRPPTFISTPFVALVGGIQPDVLGELISDGREDGLAARLLFTFPEPLPPARWTEEIVEGSCEYMDLCESLYLLNDTLTMSLLPDAKKIWIEWYDQHSEETATVEDSLRPFWSKLYGYCGRLALILQVTMLVAGETQAAHIEGHAMEGAIRLVTYFKAMCRKALAAGADSVDESRIGRALRWIKKQGGEVTARKCLQYQLVRSSEEAVTLFNDLAELGHGTVEELPRGSRVFRLKS